MPSRGEDILKGFQVYPFFLNNKITILLQINYTINRGIL